MQQIRLKRLTVNITTTVEWWRAYSIEAGLYPYRLLVLDQMAWVCREMTGVALNFVSRPAVTVFEGDTGKGLTIFS
jgi:hypothetical protein